jgi:hypothetical protein
LTKALKRYINALGITAQTGQGSVEMQWPAGTHRTSQLNETLCGNGRDDHYCDKQYSHHGENFFVHMSPHINFVGHYGLLKIAVDFRYCAPPFFLSITSYTFVADN